METKKRLAKNKSKTVSGEAGRQKGVRVSPKARKPAYRFAIGENVLYLDHYNEQHVGLIIDRVVLPLNGQDVLCYTLSTKRWYFFATLLIKDIQNYFCSEEFLKKLPCHSA